MSRFKYMGTADRRAFLTGDDMNGQMKFPLPRPIIFDWSNHHTQDSEAEENKDIPLDFWEAMRREPGFRCIDEDTSVPLNDAERLWLGKRDPRDTRFMNPNPQLVDGMEVPGVQLNKEFPTIISPPPADPVIPPMVDRYRTIEDANASAPAPEEVHTEEASP